MLGYHEITGLHRQIQSAIKKLYPRNDSPHPCSVEQALLVEIENQVLLRKYIEQLQHRRLGDLIFEIGRRAELMAHIRDDLKRRLQAVTKFNQKKLDEPNIKTIQTYLFVIPLYRILNTTDRYRYSRLSAEFCLEIVNRLQTVEFENRTIDDLIAELASPAAKPLHAVRTACLEKIVRPYLSRLDVVKRLYTDCEPPVSNFITRFETALLALDHSCHRYAFHQTSVSDQVVPLSVAIQRLETVIQVGMAELRETYQFNASLVPKAFLVAKHLLGSSAAAKCWKHDQKFSANIPTFQKHWHKTLYQIKPKYQNDEQIYTTEKYRSAMLNFSQYCAVQSVWPQFRKKDPKRIQKAQSVYRSAARLLDKSQGEFFNACKEFATGLEQEIFAVRSMDSSRRGYFATLRKFLLPESRLLKQLKKLKVSLEAIYSHHQAEVKAPTR